MTCRELVQKIGRIGTPPYGARLLRVAGLCCPPSIRTSLGPTSTRGWPIMPGGNIQTSCEEQVRAQPWFVKAMGNPIVMGALGMFAAKMLGRR
jgi:hypothetical protein